MEYSLNLNKSPSRLISIILLVIINIVVILIIIGLYRDNSLDKKLVANLWGQPLNLYDKYPIPISKSVWNIEFTEIEEVINGLEFNSNQGLIINSYTLEKLKLVISQLDSKQFDVEWERLEFLLRKSLGNKNGKLFYSLTRSYYFYQKDRTTHFNNIRNSGAIKQLILLKDSSSRLSKIQSQYFGKSIAIKLFKRENITTNYLNSRKIINLDSRLSNTEKKHKLLLLSDNYKKLIGQW